MTAQTEEHIEGLSSWTILYEVLLDETSKRILKLEDMGAPSEEDLWANLASSYSDDWKSAHKALKERQFDLEEYTSSDNSPLGAIGSALESPYIEDSQEKYNNALAEFAIIEEQLRQANQLVTKYENARESFSKKQELKILLETIKARKKETLNNPILESTPISSRKFMDTIHYDHEHFIHSTHQFINKPVVSNISPTEIQKTKPFWQRAMIVILPIIAFFSS